MQVHLYASPKVACQAVPKTKKEASMTMTENQRDQQELHQGMSNEVQRSASKKLKPNRHDEQEHHHAKSSEQHAEYKP